MELRGIEPPGLFRAMRRHEVCPCVPMFANVHVNARFLIVVVRQLLGDRRHLDTNLLRHSAASLMVDAGMPIEQVADQLGHRDLRMLQKHYRHRLRSTVAGGRVLGDLLNNAVT